MPPKINDIFRALAGVSFVTVLAALSVSVYDWKIIRGVSILCSAIPSLVIFGWWMPPDLQPTSKWHDWTANHLWLLAMHAASLGISFVLAHIHAVTVTGKAFLDVGHSLKDQRLNRRSHLPGYAAWEIHPVMKIAVND